MDENSLIKEQFKKLFKHGDPLFFDLIIKMAEIYEIKNKGYGSRDPLSNFLESERFGVPSWKGCMIRMSDKWSRLCNLVSKLDNPEYKDAIQMESIEDTLIDLANYSIICIVLLRRNGKNALS